MCYNIKNKPFEVYFTPEDFTPELFNAKMLKEEYCKANNIPLIKIPYWDINKLSQYLPIDKFNDYRNLEEKVE